MHASLMLVGARPTALGYALAAAMAALSSPAAVADVKAEVSISQSAAGQLQGTLHAEQPIEMEASGFPEFAGFATGSVGFHSAELNEARLDRFMLSPGASIQAILVGIDSGIQVFDSVDFMVLGEALSFGQPFFDYHPVFNIPVGRPGEVFSLQFVFHDASGQLSDSDVFSMSFTPVPAPGASVLLLAASLRGRARRRRN